MQGIKKNQIIAMMILTVFTVTGIPVPQSWALPLPAAAAVLPLDVGRLEVPETLGLVEDFFQGQSAQTVLILQDAHAIPEAQRHLQKLIEHFHSRYGVALTGLEGASGALDTEIFRAFPEPKRLQLLFDSFYDKGELTGGIAAAVFGNERMRTIGVENWSLYEEGLELYLNSVKNQAKNGTALSGWSQDLDARKQKAFSPQLLKVTQELIRFEKNDVDLSVILKMLAAVKPPETGSSIEAMLNAIAREGADQGRAETPLRRIAEKIRAQMDKRMPAPEVRKVFNSNQQAFLTGQLSAQAYALFLKEFLENQEGLYPGTGTLDTLSRIAGDQKKIRDIEGTNFFEEFERYVSKVKEALYRSDAERTLDQEASMLVLFEKLNSLELSRKEWRGLKSWIVQQQSQTQAEGSDVKNLPFQNGTAEEDRPGVILSDDKTRVSVLSASRNHADTPLRTGGSIVTQSKSLRTLHVELPALFKPHFEFYENAQKRDTALLRNLLRSMPAAERRSAAMLVAGGFHAQGLTQQLREQGISYALVMPQIKSVPEKTAYADEMQGRVSWRSYFRIENGRVSVYKAFVRYVRDQLLDGASPQTSMLRKNWRDETLRRLAQRGRLARAGEYTHFFDELRNSENETTNLSSFARADLFFRELRALVSGGRLTPQSFYGLLKSVHGAADLRRLAAATVVPGAVSTVAAAQSEMRAPLLGLAPLKAGAAAEIAETPEEIITPSAIPRGLPVRSEVRSGKPGTPGTGTRRTLDMHRREFLTWLTAGAGALALEAASAGPMAAAGGNTAAAAEKSFAAIRGKARLFMEDRLADIFLMDIETDEKGQPRVAREYAPYAKDAGEQDAAAFKRQSRAVTAAYAIHPLFGAGMDTLSSLILQIQQMRLAGRANYVKQHASDVLSSLQIFFAPFHLVAGMNFIDPTVHQPSPVAFEIQQGFKTRLDARVRSHGYVWKIVPVLSKRLLKPLGDRTTRGYVMTGLRDYKSEIGFYIGQDLKHSDAFERLRDILRSTKRFQEMEANASNPLELADHITFQLLTLHTFLHESWHLYQDSQDIPADRFIEPAAVFHELLTPFVLDGPVFSQLRPELFKMTLSNFRADSYMKSPELRVYGQARLQSMVDLAKAALIHREDLPESARELFQKFLNKTLADPEDYDRSPMRWHGMEPSGPESPFRIFWNAMDMLKEKEILFLVMAAWNRYWAGEEAGGAHHRAIDLPASAVKKNEQHQSLGAPYPGVTRLKTFDYEAVLRSLRKTYQMVSSENLKEAGFRFDFIQNTGEHVQGALPSWHFDRNAELLGPSDLPHNLYKEPVLLKPYSDGSFDMTVPAGGRTKDIDLSKDTLFVFGSFDEPQLGFLEAATISQWETLRRLREEFGKKLQIVLVVTHTPRDAAIAAIRKYKGSPVPYVIDTDQTVSRWIKAKTGKRVLMAPGFSYVNARGEVYEPIAAPLVQGLSGYEALRRTLEKDYLESSAPQEQPLARTPQPGAPAGMGLDNLPVVSNAFFDRSRMSAKQAQALRSDERRLEMIPVRLSTGRPSAKPGSRSEVRIAAAGQAREMLAGMGPALARFLIGRQLATEEELRTWAEQGAFIVVQLGQNEFETFVREQMPPAVSGAVQVSPALERYAMKRILNNFTASRPAGAADLSVTMGFDAAGQEASLKQVMARPAVRRLVGRGLLSKAMDRETFRSVKGINLSVFDPARFGNQKNLGTDNAVVFVLTNSKQVLRMKKYAAALTRAPVAAESRLEQETFFGPVANLVEILAGAAASSMKEIASTEDLAIPATQAKIRAELLRRLFASDLEASELKETVERQLFKFEQDENGISLRVDHSVLFRVVTEIYAKQAVSSAA